MGSNSTQSETSSFLQSVCFHYPNAIPKVWPSVHTSHPSVRRWAVQSLLCSFQCEAFTKIYGSQLQKVLGNQKDATRACEVRINSSENVDTNILYYKAKADTSIHRSSHTEILLDSRSSTFLVARMTELTAVNFTFTYWSTHFMKKNVDMS